MKDKQGKNSNASRNNGNTSGNHDHDHDDDNAAMAWYHRIEEDRRFNAVNIAVGVLSGIAVGVAVGILVAPMSGTQTRNNIAQGTRGLGRNIRGRADRGLDSVNQLIGRADETLGNIGRQVKDGFNELRGHHDNAENAANDLGTKAENAANSLVTKAENATNAAARKADNAAI